MNGRRDDLGAELASRWSGLLADLTGAAEPVGVSGGGHASPAAGAEPTGADLLGELLAAYGAPGRSYHGPAHLGAVLSVLDELWGPNRLPPPAWVRAAAWFHDAVYDPTRPDNEAASAAWARRALPTVGAASPAVELAARLVEATASHHLSPELARQDGADCFLDADLAVLGAPPTTYDAYAAAIRAEYRHLDDDAFRHGRRQVLAGLAARPRLFLSVAGRRRFEAQARANLRRELASLQEPRPAEVSGGGAAGRRCADA